jgi:hypothetical protein
MRISPSQITQFLTLRGWGVETLDKFPQLLTFTHPMFPRRQLFLPSSEAASDFDDAVHFLLTKLAAIERKELHDVKIQLERTDGSNTSDLKDSMALRILKSVSDEESIPLTLANAVIRETEVILMVGSCMAENAQHHYRRIDNKISNDIYNRSVFNHTQRGSFIMSVSCSILAVGEQLGLGFDSNGWTKSRRAFVTIYRGMKHLTDAISADQEQKFSDEMLASTSPSVSSNFCAALANIISRDSGDGIKVGFDWSPYVPLPYDVDIEAPIHFSPFMSEGLYRISDALLPKALSLDDSFVGTVEALQGDVTTTGERAGGVEFLLLLKDGTTIRASASLSVEQYRLADKAHIEGARYVSIAGKLDSHPRVWIFESIRSFSLIDA